MKIFLVSLLLITFSLISSCSAAVHPLIETNERIPRSNSFDELSCRSTAQMTVYSDKTEFFSTKRPYSKRQELTDYQRDLVLGRHPSAAFTDVEGTKKPQQLKQLKNQQLMPRRKQRRDDNDLCTGVCSIS